ncbi:hypothetical protein N8Z24_00165 [bacterium]|nr:hypothetical protein [bacterium]
MEELSIKFLSEMCKWFGISQYGVVDSNEYENLVLEACEYINFDISDEDLDKVLELLEEEGDILSA